jgi:hypothetical protein
MGTEKFELTGENAWRPASSLHGVAAGRASRTVVVTAASADDGTKTPRVLGQLAHRWLPLLEVVWAEGK